MNNDINKLSQLFRSGYTFDEGIAALSRWCNNKRIVQEIKRRHRFAELDKELRRTAKTMHLNIDKPLPCNTKEVVHPAAAPKKQPPAKQEKHKVTFLSLSHYDNTRLEDMPNDLCRKLWYENHLRNIAIKEHHLRMRRAKTDDERATERAEVLRIDADRKSCWDLINKEIKNFKETAAQTKTAAQTEDINIGSYRSYISKALNSGKLSDKKLVEVQHRVSELVKRGIPMKPDTVKKLKELGINV